MTAALAWEEAGSDLKPLANCGKGLCKHAPAAWVLIENPSKPASYLPYSSTAWSTLSSAEEGHEGPRLAVPAPFLADAQLLHGQPCAARKVQQAYAAATSLPAVWQIEGQEPHQQFASGTYTVFCDPLDGSCRGSYACCSRRGS